MAVEPGTPAGVSLDVALRYAPTVAAPLLACPFCRELFARGETEGICPDCGVRLEPLDQLPPSLDVLAEEEAAGEPVAMEDRPLPWHHFGRGRGALLGVAAAGLLAFFLPWVEVWSPYDATFSGFTLAARGASWLWGGVAGWFVLIPLVISRRTIAQMRGVRAISALFAALTAAEIVMLVALPPKQHQYVIVDYRFAWGLYASAALSAAGVWLAARLGGRLGDPRANLESDGEGPRRVESSSGRILH